jgi:cystinosin
MIPLIADNLYLLLLIVLKRTTHGLSVDFCVLNVLGYVCYTAYTTNFYFNKQIIAEYKDRMSSKSNVIDEAQITVQGNDVAFAVHAVLMASVTLSQIGIYDSFPVRPPSRRVYFILLLAFIFCTIYIVGTLIFDGQVDFLGFLYVLGSIKIGVTIGKYVPQALLNQSRKSTVGWNVWNVILDLTGKHFQCDMPSKCINSLIRTHAEWQKQHSHQSQFPCC